MPAQAARRPDAESRKNVARLNKEIAEGRVPADNPMRDLNNFLDLYCRSALGANTQGVSAMAFVNFYISELEVRYTSPTGTGIAITRMQERLEKKGELSEILTSASVGKIENKDKFAEVTYVVKGSYLAKADYVIFAAQSKLAPSSYPSSRKGSRESRRNEEHPVRQLLRARRAREGPPLPRHLRYLDPRL